MKVAEIMTSNVKACAPHDTLHLAAGIMWENDCGCVPVVDNGRLAGIVTDRDICMAAYTQGLNLHSLQASAAMAATVVTCAPEDDLVDAEKLMRQNKVRRLPVVESGGKLTGIISLSDIAREAERERLEKLPKKVKAADLALTLGAISGPHDHTQSPVTHAPEEGEIEFKPSPPRKRGHLRKPHTRKS